MLYAVSHWLFVKCTVHVYSKNPLSLYWHRMHRVGVVCYFEESPPDVELVKSERYKDDD